MPKKPMGFAAMTLEQRRAIAAKGGASVPPEKRGFSHGDLASRAGRKGGLARQRKAREATDGP